MNYSKFKDVINKLYPLNRSLAGEDNFKSLSILKNHIYKNLKINFFLSGKKVFDWKIPNEWKVSNAFIKDKNGKDIIDLKMQFTRSILFLFN